MKDVGLIFEGMYGMGQPLFYLLRALDALLPPPQRMHIPRIRQQFEHLRTVQAAD